MDIGNSLTFITDWHWSSSQVSVLRKTLPRVLENIGMHVSRCIPRSEILGDGVGKWPAN